MDTVKRKWYEFDSAMLHILAMVFMLSDHSWSTLFPSHRWMTGIGRIAFPIFAFMIVEGYHHTHNLKKYITRMFIFALISEIPFDLMVDGVLFYPFHQNVMWTFLIALFCMWVIDKAKAKEKWWLTVIVALLMSVVGAILGFACFVDYYGVGVLTVLVFYFFRGKKWWCYAGQFVLMYWLNVELLGGFYYPVTIFGIEFEIIEQGLALIALIPIWLYRGRQGYHSKLFQYFCYAFYPGHMLLLVIIGMIMQNFG